MLKNKLSFLGMASAMLGLTSGLFGKKERVNVYGDFTRSLKPRQWHDPMRLDAAEARRATRQARNLRHASAGGYGPDWQAL